MKKKSYINRIFSAVIAVSIVGIMTGCIDETTPESNYLTADQVNESSTAVSGLANAIAGKFSQEETYGKMEYDLGYSGLCLIRDVMGEDMSLNAASYDYFSYWGADTYLGENWSTVYYPWTWYYQLVNNCNQLLSTVKGDNETNLQYIGIARFYRAWAYFDMARMYEYKQTGISELDNEAQSSEIYGLTVPKITETTTEAEARNTPRLPFYEMYKFILDDLDAAESDLENYARTSKNMPDLSVVYGEKARVYLDMATRFRLHEDQLEQYKASGIDLGVSSAKECYTLAASNVAKALNRSGYTVLSESEWYGNGITGFNSSSENSWMLSVIVTKENLSSSSWRNFIGHVSPEQTFGVGGITQASDGSYTNTYKAQRTINKALFDAIDDNDWRKTTWLDPNDAGNINPSLLDGSKKYVTTVPDAMFKAIPAYSSFKFRPVDGERNDYSTAAAADFPLMRCEELYFIQMEAELYGIGLSNAKTKLETFMNNYRMKSGCTYTCAANDADSFIKEMMVQKRAEFWGEGITYWDYKRLELGVTRGYKGTNYPSAYRINSKDDGHGNSYVLCTFNFCIPKKELGLNSAMTGKGNPDPSNKATLWSE